MNRRIVVRNIAVIALALIAIVFSVSDIVIPWHPYGVLGVVIAPDRTVVYVNPKSQAAEAGVRAGDRVDFQAMSERDQLSFNDAAIFRRRRSGEERLRLVADGLIHANTATSISRLMVHESIEAFGLASAAVFEADESGDYALVDGAGWESDGCSAIDHDSSLVLRLIASTAPLRMSWSDVAALPGSPTDAKAPALAVPIVFRGELDGFVLFGAHRSGEEIDSAEVTSLSALARAAASAYDHLDARPIRARLAAFEATASAAASGAASNGVRETP